MFLKQGPSKIKFVEKLWTKEKSLVYGGPSLPIKKNKNNKNEKIKNENKKIEKKYSEKTSHEAIMGYECQIW